MPTINQEKALEALVEAGRTKKRIIKGQVLVNAGYSKKTAIAPDKVFKSKGFLHLCEERGLTDKLLTEALVADIKSKKGKRVKELELGFKVRQRLEPEQGFQNKILIVNITPNAAGKYGIIPTNPGTSTNN